jgi:hypothetical protein
MTNHYNTPLGPGSETSSSPRDGMSAISAPVSTPATRSAEGTLYVYHKSRLVSRELSSAETHGPCLLLLLDDMGDRLAVIGHPQEPIVGELLAGCWVVRGISAFTQVVGLFRVLVSRCDSSKVEPGVESLGARP